MNTTQRAKNKKLFFWMATWSWHQKGADLSISPHFPICSTHIFVHFWISWEPAKSGLPRWPHWALQWIYRNLWVASQRWWWSIVHFCIFLSLDGNAQIRAADKQATDICLPTVNSDKRRKVRTRKRTATEGHKNFYSTDYMQTLLTEISKKNKQKKTLLLWWSYF